MAFSTELLLFGKNTLHSSELRLRTLLLLLKYFNRKLSWRIAGNRGSGCLQPLFVVGILLVQQVKSTSHECAAANFINHLSFHPLLELHSKMFKHPGQ